MSGGYTPKVHLRTEASAGIAKCGLGGRNAKLTDDPAEVTCAACSQGWEARPSMGRRWHEDWAEAGRDGDGNQILRHKPTDGMYKILPVEEC